MQIIVQTPRLIIREFSPEEEESYIALFDDELVTRHLPQRTREQHIKIFRDGLAEYTTGKVPGRWGMYDAAGGGIIGMCLLRHYADEPGAIEVGYAMFRAYWGKGYGTEMTRALIPYGFEHSDTNVIVAVTTLENTASQNVLLKAGLTRVDDIIRDGEQLAYFKMYRPGI